MKGMKERMAPPDMIWVCVMCGKTAEDQYGITGEHSRGWDESCVLNSQLFNKTDLNFLDGRVSSIGNNK